MLKETCKMKKMIDEQINMLQPNNGESPEE